MWGDRKKMCVTSIISGTKVFVDKFSDQKLDNLFKLTVCNFWTLAVGNLSLTETALKN